MGLIHADILYMLLSNIIARSPGQYFEGTLLNSAVKVSMDIDHSHIQSRQETFQLISPLHLQRPYSLPVSATAVQGETPPFRNAKVVSHLPITPENEVRSVTDLVRRAAKFFGNKPAVGFRTEIRTHLKESSDKKQLIISELSSYKFLYYIEYEQLVTNIGSGLVKAGLLSSHDKICMWGQTRSVNLYQPSELSSRPTPFPISEVEGFPLHSCADFSQAMHILCRFMHVR